MLLLDNTLEVNWTNFYNEGYYLYFELELSKSIHKIQLEIKNKTQRKFVDIEIRKCISILPLQKLAKQEEWSSILEICFVVFLDNSDNSYMEGSDGFVKIKQLKLTKNFD